MAKFRQGRQIIFQGGLRLPWPRAGYGPVSNTHWSFVAIECRRPCSNGLCRRKEVFKI